MKKIGIYTFIYSLLLVGCHSQKSQEENSGVFYQGETLCIPDNSPILSKIELKTIQPQPYSAEFRTTGTVRAVTGCLAEIAPPFDGRIVRSAVRLGQKVSAGTPVFELSSADFYEASKNYFQTLQTQNLTEIELQRQKDLVQHGVGVQKELEEAETSHALADKEFENALAGMNMFQINPDELVMGQALKIVSPIAGEIVKNNIVLGQYVKSDSEPLLIVAELSKVWVVAQVKEKYISSIHPDDQVRITTESNVGEEITGRVYHIGELLDEETRSIEVLVECDNKDRKLKPGMFAGVHFINAPVDAIVAPSSALLQSEAGTYVYVQTGKNQYVKRFVETVTAGPNETMISKGLEAGEIIVSGGGIYMMGI
ncbi:MAG: efflux RND transporter periplasmic adaptor subunit [Tannerella sp.]|jgi:cobalt-zinc-cadmium efflux system membrane fusion protein|nr:efflux RND transporter periplasmic adaptor subunit [Tannerella sp.]